MKKILFLVLLILSFHAFAELATVLQCPASQVDYTFNTPVQITGTVKNFAKQAVPDATVSFYLPSGEFVAATTTDPSGKYSVSLPPNPYNASAFNPSGTGVWNGNTPRDAASRILIKDKSSVNFVLNDIKPMINSISNVFVAGSKNTIVEGYQILGTGFGKSRGYVDVAGYLTNSSTYIKFWSDTQIEVVKGSNMPLSGCFKVFSKYSGYSDCFDFAYQPPS